MRDGLRSIPGVIEHVKFLGPQWRWAWEYTLGNRKLCWIHVMQDGVSATFTISDVEERKVDDSRLPAVVTQAITEAQRTGPVRWCWLALLRPAAGDGVPRVREKEGGMDAGGGASGLVAAGGGVISEFRMKYRISFVA